MSNQRDAGTLEDYVLPRERELLGLRRKAAGFEKSLAEGGGATEPQEIADSAVGLAISGGGLRAASFSLGIVQAFYRRGLLRFCDYLSTVSGGSYVGAFVASLGHHKDSKLEWKPGPPDQNGPSGAAHRLTLNPGPHGEQPAYIRRLIYGGSYLNRPLLFVNNWLPGFLLMNVLATSLLVSVCALLAYLFRTIDRTEVTQVLRSLGFGDDLSRAFFPATVTFLIWAGLLAINSVVAFARGKRVATRTAKGLTLALIVVTLLCAVSLLGVGEVDTKLLKDWLQIDIPNEWKESLQYFARWTFYSILAVGILPYLTPRKLLQSGSAESAQWYEREIFRVTTAVLFWGCPLFVFAYLARENVSYYNNLREDRHLLAGTSITDWESFWNRLRADAALAEADPAFRSGNGETSEEAKGQVEKGKKILAAHAALAKQLWTRVTSEEAKNSLEAAWLELPPGVSEGKLPKKLEPEEVVKAIANNELVRRRHDKDATLTERWFGAVRELVGRQDHNEFYELLTAEWEHYRNREVALAYFNAALASPEFSDDFTTTVEYLASLQDQELAEWPHLAGLSAEPTEKFRLARTNIIDKYHRAREVRRLLYKEDEEKRQVTRQRPAQSHDQPTPSTSEDGEASTAASTSQAGVIDFLTKVRGYRLRNAFYGYVMDVNGDHDPRYDEWKTARNQVRGLLELKVNNPDNRLFRQQMDQLTQANFELLQAYFGPKMIASPETVFRTVVIDHDQDARLWIALVAFGVFAVAGLVDLNQTTLHNFYRDQLASVWIVKPEGEEEPSLTNLESTARGAPLLLINCATIHFSQAKVDDEPTESYVLSEVACGSSRFEYASTKSFARGQFPLTLADAMAISGAAMTPVASRNLAVRSLLWLLNFRLGQWLPNPSIDALRQPPMFYRRLWCRPQPLHILLSKALYSEAQQPFVFVCDGGHHDNLGIETLLLRRCRLIIAIDTEADPKGQFEGLVTLLFRVRVRHGITIESLDDKGASPLPLPLAELAASAARGADDCGKGGDSGQAGPRAAEKGIAKHRFIVARIRYPEAGAPPSYLLYLRPCFLGDEWAELARYRAQNENFPHDQTLDQFYSPSRFEAYRLLGEFTGLRVAQELLNRVQKMEDPGSHEALIAAVNQLGKQLQSGDKPSSGSQPSDRSRAADDASPLHAAIDALRHMADEIKSPEAAEQASEKVAELQEDFKEAVAEKPVPRVVTFGGNGHKNGNGRSNKSSRRGGKPRK